MGVYIKGMDMPESCMECPLFRKQPRYYCTVSSAKVSISAEIGVLFEPLKPKDCPLVSVPTPHGRLVDADEITKDMNTFQDSFAISVLDGRFKDTKPKRDLQRGKALK